MVYFDPTPLSFNNGLRFDDPPSTDDLSLAQARQVMLSQRDDPGGTFCPCCTQHVQLYRRKLHSGMVASLISMYRSGGLLPVHTPTVLGKKQADEAKMRWWGLIEECDVTRDDGGRAGWWRVTQLGEQFVLGRSRVPSHALVYLNDCEGFDGELVDVRQALGERFRYDDLMSGE